MANRNALSRRRPKQSRSDETRRCVVEAAKQLLSNESFDAFSIRKVAAAASVSVGTIYEYFPSKQALLFWVVEARLKERMQVLDGVLAADSLEGQTLAEVIAASINALRDAGMYSRLDLEIRTADERDAKLKAYSARYTEDLTSRYITLWRHFGATASDDDLRFIAEYAHQLDTLSMKTQLTNPDREEDIRSINQMLLHVLAERALAGDNR